MSETDQRAIFLLPLPSVHQALEFGAAGEGRPKSQRSAGLHPRQHGRVQVGLEAMAVASVGVARGRPRARGGLPNAGGSRNACMRDKLRRCLVTPFQSMVEGGHAFPS